MFAPRLVTPPSDIDPGAVSLEELKHHLNVDTSDYDATIYALGSAATKHLDGWTGILGGLCLVTQTWSHSFECFPSGESYLCRNSSTTRNVLRLKLAPVIAVTSIKYYDTDGVLQTVNPSNYRAQEDALGWFIAAAPGVTSPWPSSLQRRNDAVVVEATFGFGGVADVPEDIRTAIAMKVKRIFEGAKRDLSLRSETVDGVGSQTFGSTEMMKVNTEIEEALLGHYRRSFFV
jgi:uncharacterized phiE125 gp8 family phage protein